MAFLLRIAQIMKRILLADDEESILLAYKKLLSSNDVAVDTSQTVSEALYRLKEQHYEAVIVDLCLSGTAEMDGLKIVEFVKSLSPQSKVIVLTAFDDNRIREKVIFAGAYCFLEKPVSAFLIRDLLKEIGVYNLD